MPHLWIISKSHLMTNTKMLLTCVLALDDQPNTLQFRRCLLFKALGRQKCEHSLVPRSELPARQSGRETFMSAAGLCRPKKSTLSRGTGNMLSHAGARVSQAAMVNLID